MVNRKRQLLIFILLASALMFLISGINLIVKGNNQVFSIYSDYFSGGLDNIKFFKMRNSIVLVSTAEDFSGIEKISKIDFDQSGSTMTAYQLYDSKSSNNKYIDAYVQDDNIFLVSAGVFLVDDENNIIIDAQGNMVSAAKIEKCDSNLNKISSIDISTAIINGVGHFAVDENENYFVINSNDSNNKKLEKYDSAGKKVADLESNFNLLSLSKTLSDQIIADTSASDAIVLVGESDGLIEYELSQYKGDAPTLPVNFISKDIIIDNNSNVYNLGDTLEFFYSALTDNNIACQYGDDTVVACENTLLLLDNNGFPVSQFDLQNTPDLIIKTDDIVSCFNFSKINNGEIIIETVSSEPSELQYQEFDYNDNAFIAEPGENPYTLDEISAYDNWKISFNKEVIALNAQENINIKIKALDSENNITLQNFAINEDNSISFSSPEDLSSGIYDIIVSGLRTDCGKPALCKYSVTIKENTTTSTTSTTSSTSKVSKTSKTSTSKTTKTTTSSTSKTNKTSTDTSTKNTQSTITEHSQAISGKIESSIYTIDRSNNTILGVESGTTLAQFKKNISYTGTIYAVKNTGVSIKSGKVATGTKIYLMNADTELDCLTIIIKGDLTGEGNVNSNDVQQAYNYLLGENNLDEYALLALDLMNKDGDINLVDLILLNRLAKSTRNN